MTEIHERGRRSVAKRKNTTETMPRTSAFGQYRRQLSHTNQQAMGRKMNASRASVERMTRPGRRRELTIGEAWDGTKGSR